MEIVWQAIQITRGAKVHSRTDSTNAGNRKRNDREIYNFFRQPIAIPAAPRTIIGVFGGWTWEIGA
jgi:hypothetical protein